MIKNSEFDFAYDYLRLDASWVFQWDFRSITNDTRRLYPFSEMGTSKTWYFKGDKTATITHNEFTWNADQPWMEYDSSNPDAWDAAHPGNLTRKLTPGSSYIKLCNTIEHVIIDNIPPAFVSDRGTEYIVIQTDNKVKATRHCEFIFHDKAGLDYSNFVIKVGDKDGPKGQEVLLYACKRKLDYFDGDGKNINGYGKKPANENDYIAGGVNPYVNEHYIVPSTIRICSDGFNTYKIAFDLIDNNDLVDLTTGEKLELCALAGTDEEILSNALNNYGLTIEIWDKAANKSSYTFGCEDGAYTKLDGYSDLEQPFKRRWRLIDTLDDLTELQPLVIKFYDADPANLTVDEHQEGSVWCTIYNPNVDFRCIDLKYQLSDASIGMIDPSTIDDSQYFPEPNRPDHPKNQGVIKFKIINIREYGNVEVEAWLKSGNKNFDDIIRTSTYALESIGPWLCIDAEGRKYNLKPFVPTYLKNTDYFEFIKFFELYLNTLYTNLTKNTNISILEKIAKIGDFNDIDRIEHCMMYHYAKHYGAEFDIDLQTMLDLNLGFYAEGALATRTEDDVLDIVRYALKNLPYYNRIKGTNNGMVMALKMFSLSCKIINLWCKIDPPIEEKADFIEEDRMYNFTNHFLTSRFNIEFNSLNIDFQSFNNSLDVFIKFIKSIKPITRILNLIKYTVIFEKNLFWNVNQHIEDDSDGRGCCIYKINWSNDNGFIDEFYERTKIDWKRLHTERMWIPYNCDNCKVELYGNGTQYNENSSALDWDPVDLDNAYTLLSHLVSYSNYKLIFGYANKFVIRYQVMDPETGKLLVYTDETTGEKTTWKTIIKTMKFNKTVDMKDLSFRMLDTGFYIVPHDGEASTSLAECMKPTYFVDNILTQEIMKLQRDNPKKSYYIYDQKVYDAPYMTMWIQHIPGTELIYCLYPELPVIEPIYPEHEPEPVGLLEEV